MSGEAPSTASATRIVDDHHQFNLRMAVATLGVVFWIVGGMEMVERLAFYGVKAVAALYATAPRAEGGLGVTASVFGDVLMLWAFTQSVLPVFVGGLADRFGYKRTIFVSTVVKMPGYLTMAWIPTYLGFLTGAVLLATGTAISNRPFKERWCIRRVAKIVPVAWGLLSTNSSTSGAG